MKLLVCTQAVDKNHPILGFFHGWIEEFARHFAEVHVICLQKGEYNLPNNVFVYSLGKEDGVNRFTYFWRFYTYFWHIFFNVRVEYVFFHMGAIYNLLASPFFFIRKIYKTQFYWWKTHGHINLMGRTALLFVDRVYTAIEESFPVQSKKRIVVGHAIDTKLFFPSQEKEPGHLLFVGRFSRSKRIEQFLQIIHNLKKQGMQVHGTCIGAVADTDYYTYLQQRVVDLDLSKDIRFVEGVAHPQLVAEYQKAYVFINPSDNDGLDKVVLEAMLCGTIPISANKSFQQILSPYGLFMKKGDIDGYVKTVIQLLKKDTQEYLVLSEKLVQEVQNNHALDTLTQRIFK